MTFTKRRHDDYDPRKVRRSAVAVVWTAIIALFLILAGLLFSLPTEAATRSTVSVPTVSAVYRIKIEREAARNFGIEAPAARLAAQIHQESAWKPRAASIYANGLAQFTPATAAWLPTVCPAVGPPDAWDPDWSLRAQACYMAWLYKGIVPYRYAGALSACSHWNFALRAYNGGAGWLNKERLLTQRVGGNANAWDDVERHQLRASWAHNENVRYPRRILLEIEPAYLAAGWPGQAVCT